MNIIMNNNKKKDKNKKNKYKKNKDKKDKEDILFWGILPLLALRGDLNIVVHTILEDNPLASWESLIQSWGWMVNELRLLE
jgi:hypothetical protein